MSLAAWTWPGTGPDGREGVNLVFDGGLVEAGTQVVLGDELVSSRWEQREELRELVAPHTHWRVTTALDVLFGAIKHPGVPYLVGHPTKPA